MVEQGKRLFPGAPFQWSLDAVIFAILSAGKTWATWNSEMLNFALARFEQDAQLFQNLAKCSNAEDIAEVERAWARQACLDYEEENARLIEHTGSMSLHVAEQIGEES